MSQPWFFFTGLGGFLGMLCSCWCCIGVMLLVPVDADVVAVVRTPVATVVMYDGFPLFSRGTVDMSGTMVGAV